MTNIKPIVVAIATVLFILSSSAFGQSISIVSGNGQLGCALCIPQGGAPFLVFNPITVQVKDAAGKPLPGATVTWTFASDPITQAGSGGVTNSTTITDSNGQASTTFSLSALVGSLFSRSYVSATITATLTALPAGTTGTTGQTVQFTETSALTDRETNPGAGTGIVQVSANLVSPLPGTTLTGPAGSTSTVPIQITVTGINNVGVPNVAVLIAPPSDPSQPSIACATPTTPGAQPNTVFTDASGNATCNVVFGKTQGQGTAVVDVGQTNPPFFSRTINFVVTTGVPGAVVPSTGNNQSGNAGANLPAPLVAIVQDQAGNPLAGVNVTWAVASGSATLFNVRTVSDTQGRVSANLTLGSTPGNVQIKVTVDGQPQVAAAVFNATVNLSISQFSAVSGSGQSAPVSSAFPSPLIVQVSNNGQPVAGVSVAFAVTSGSVTLSSPTATTNSAGQAQVTVQAGANAGPAVVTATIGTFTQTFNLTVAPPGPTLTANSFQNAASHVPGAISPCSLATIVAQGVAPGMQGAILPPIIGALPILLNNTSVAFSAGGGPISYAPIWDIANINGQESMTIEIPCELSPGTVSVTVNVGTGNRQINVTLQPAAPGIFEQQGSDNKLRAVIIRPDGSFASKESPVRRGETVHMLVTGVGPVNPQIGTNQVGIPDTDSNAVDSFVVGINDSGIPVLKVIYAHDLVGIYDVSFMVPQDAPTGDVRLAFAVVINGQFNFAQGSIIPIQ